MRAIRQWLARATVALALAAVAQPNAENATAIAGTVVDEAGRPVEGASVEVHSPTDGSAFAVSGLQLDHRVVTDDKGAFKIDSPTGRFVLLLARQPGFAPTWRQFVRGAAEAPTLVLPSPSVLAGIVVDETEQPVGGAEVSVYLAYSESPGPQGANYLGAPLARECFSTRTGPGGHFRIDGFPTNASANLMVRHPGKALRQPAQGVMGPDSMQWLAGQEDIRLVVEPAGIIEGRVAAEDASQHLPAAELTLQSDGPAGFGIAMDRPVVANADGTFRITDVGGGNYRLRAVFGTNTPPDWVAESVPVSVVSGQTAAGIELKAIRGGLLEVLVLGKENRQGQPDVSVSVYHQNHQASAKSDATGTARLRLPPGDYQLAAQKDNSAAANTTATVESDQSNRVEIELVGPQKVKGVVRRPDGQPAPGLPVRIIGSFSPDAAIARTDADGRFELEWNPDQFGGQEGMPCLLIRDAERNLAIAHDLEKESGPLALSLEPAMSIAGRAEFNGQPVTNTTAALIFWTGNSGMHLQDVSSVTDIPGQFEIRALPTGRRYGLQVSAPRHGQTFLQSIDSDEPKRIELEPVELKPAILQLAGQVVDADEKPVPGANVYLHGEGQPSHNTRADPEGRFTFSQVCEGPAQLVANARNTHGSTSADGGTTNVVLRLSETYGMGYGSVQRRLKGTVTGPDNQPVAGAQVAVFPFTEARQKTDAAGAFDLTFNMQPWQLQSGGDPCLVVRDPARNLAAAEFVTEETTNVTIQLQPALTLTGRVEGIDGSPLPKAEVGVWLLACRTYNQLNEQLDTTDANGVFNIKTVPPGVSYTVFATAKGHGRQQQGVDSDSVTDRLELEPFELKAADQVIAGQVFDDRERPVSGAHVSVSGDDQPDGSATTDSKGRFRFMVCEGQVRLFVSGQNGYANLSADPGDTNIVVQLSRSGSSDQDSPRRATLKGKPLPDLAAVGLAADASSDHRSLVLCLFDAEQRPSRRAVRLLAEQHAILTAKGVAVAAVQTVVTSDESFNEWKESGAPPFPVGRVTAKSAQTRWATEVGSLPWLILSDSTGKVIAEGFALDELDAHLDALR
jgi:protocatechuate 3,4-dioxygenase beta subunit